MIWKESSSIVGIDLLDFLLEEGNMAKVQQTATELQRALAGQWTKSEKREEASRQILAAKKRTHEINKAIKQATFLAK